MSRTRHLFWALPALLLLCGPLWWPVATALLAPPAGSALSPAVPGRGLTMTGVHLTQHTAGRKQVEITAARVTSAAGERSPLEMTAIEAGFPGPDSRGITVSGRQGSYDPDRELLRLTGEVRVSGAQGYDLRTPALTYEGRKRDIVSDQPVSIVGKGLQVEGQGLLYDLDSGFLRVEGPLSFMTR